MSAQKSKLALFVSSKLKNLNNKMKESDNDTITQVLESYSTFFVGALGALQAVEADEADVTVLENAFNLIDKMKELHTQKIEFEKSLEE